jgi:hypothetical protein
MFIKLPSVAENMLMTFWEKFSKLGGREGIMVDLK